MNKVMNWKGFLFIACILLVCFVILFSVLRGQLSGKKAEENNKRLSLSRLEDENKELLSRLELVGTDAYIAASAIEDYSYMNRDDIRFTFTNPEVLDAYTEEEWKILMEEMTD